MACMGSYCSIINFAPVCFCSKIEVHTDFPKMSTKRTIVRRPVAEQALLLLFLVLSSMEVTKKGSGVGFAFAFFAGAPTSSTIIRQQRIFLHMTPPTRPGEMPRDETPMDSTNYFQSRGVTVDLEANKPNPLEVQTNVRTFFVFVFFLPAFLSLLSLTLSRHTCNTSTYLGIQAYRRR